MRKIESKSSKLVVLLALLLCIALAFVFLANENYENAVVDEQQVEKIYYDGSVEEDFADDTVLITLNKEATRQFLTYTPEDFPEIDCCSVEDLTGCTVDWVEKQVNGEKTEETMLIDIENYRRILSLELSENSKENVVNAIKLLETREDIYSAKPNYTLTICAVPDDEYYTDQWGLSNVEAPSAWDISTGSNAVTVGVLDTGINASHDDLIDNISDAGLHRDFTDTDNTTEIDIPTDLNGHGTHVAGIIAAQGDNEIGVTGVCWSSIELVSLRVLDEYGDGSLLSVARAISFAETNNISILNCSFGAIAGLSYLEEQLSAYSGLVVCAAGNTAVSHDDNYYYNDDGEGAIDYEDVDNNNDTNPIYPCSYTLDNIISVGASNSSDNKGYWDSYDEENDSMLSYESNYGSESVDLFAPGVNIYSTYYGGYECMSGTSMAAPMVTGAAALLLSYDSSLSTDEIKSAILDNVDTISNLDGLCLTGGRLNINNAIRSIWNSGFIYQQSEWEIDQSLGLETTNLVDTVCGDYNGDGKDDIAMLYGYDDTMEILKWHSDGTTFCYDGSVCNTPALTVSQIIKAVSGDYNGDGNDDIAVLYDTGDTTKILLWQSDGANFWYYGYVCNTTTLIGSQIKETVSGDYNGDGTDDIAVLYDYGDTTKIIMWQGDNLAFWYLGPVCNTPTFYADQIIDIASGEFTDDGVDDIIVLYDYGTVKVILWNAEDSAFWYHGTVCNTSTLYSSPVTGITSGDYNLDGIDDIAVLYETEDTTRVLLWTSDGSNFWYNGYVCNNQSGIDSDLILSVVGGDFDGCGKGGIVALYDNDGYIQMHVWL
jgi:subtilisin family serine protease